jgi:leucyl aminopeptidase (aminopeptidase T)
LPYVMQVREGRLMECPQDPELIRKYKEIPGRDLLCEVAFGTNHAANKNAECIMEVEKVLGTAHVAFGSNVDFGGANQSDVHMDFVFDKITLTLDGKTIIDKGEHCY